MAGDVHEQVFNETQFYTADVLAEDADVTGFDLPLLVSAGFAERPPDGVLRKSSLSEHGISLPSTLAGHQRSNEQGAKSSAGPKEKRRKRAAERASKIIYWLDTKYDVLPEVCSNLENWKEASSVTCDFDLYWCDTAIPAERFMKLKLYQKMNHFVGMSSITRKNNLGRNLLRMRKQYPKEYRFFPDTWILPTDLSDFKLQFGGKNKTFIIKPDNGCQGKGIFLVKDVEKVPVDFSTTYVAQRYINKPFLLDGFKFDLRLYVLVGGCDPLRIFLHKRGLVRLASEQYVEPTGKNLQQSMIHLTNYAINKMNPNFEENTNPDDAQDGHKRSWEAVQAHLRSEGHDVDLLNAEIEDLIVKTLITVQPSLSHFYHSCQPEDVENSMCFEILGFDVMLDHKLQPWLLEVNHAPSFATESELDKVVKTEVLRDTFRLLNMDPEARRQKKRLAREKMEQRAMGTSKKATLEERMLLEEDLARERTIWEDQRLGSYKRLYPSAEKEQEYLHIHEAAVNIWEMLMGGTSRRTIRVSNPTPQEDEVCSDKNKNRKNSKEGGGEDSSGDKKVKRTTEQMREVVDRLMNGCSARPRVGESRRQNGRQGEKDAPLAPAEMDVGKEMAATASGKPGRPEVQVGEVIKVQTNLGWESVTVRAKRTNGKIDIQFKDGEYMRSVLPRILRETPTVISSEEQPVAQVASSGSVVQQFPPSAREHSPGAAQQRQTSATPTPSGSVSVGSGSTPVRSQGAVSSAREAGNLETASVPRAPSVVEGVSDLHSGAQQRFRRHRATQPIIGVAMDVPLAVAPSTVAPQGGGSLRTTAALRSVGNGALAAWSCPVQDSNRLQDVRLRHQLGQLINVRPISTRRVEAGTRDDKP